MSNIGNKVTKQMKKVIKESGKTQKQLAKALYIDESNFSKKLRCEKPLSLGELIKIANMVCDGDLLYLLTGYKQDNLFYFIMRLNSLSDDKLKDKTSKLEKLKNIFNSCDNNYTIQVKPKSQKNQDNDLSKKATSDYYTLITKSIENIYDKNDKKLSVKEISDRLGIGQSTLKKSLINLK